MYMPLPTHEIHVSIQTRLLTHLNVVGVRDGIQTFLTELGYDPDRTRVLVTEHPDDGQENT